MESDNLQRKIVQMDKKDSLCHNKVKLQTTNLLSNICEPTIYTSYKNGNLQSTIRRQRIGANQQSTMSLINGCKL